MSTFVETRQQVITALGFFWIKVFLDDEFIRAYTPTVTLKHTDIADATDRLPNYLSRLLIPVTELHSHRLFTLNEADLDTVAARYGKEGLEYGAGQMLYGQKLTEFEVFKYPFDSKICPQFLAAEFAGGSSVLEKDVDFFIEDNVITFLRDPLKLPELIKSATVDSNGDPVFRFFLWGFSVKEDIDALCNYFGTLAGICGETSTPKLKEAINIAWDLRIEGASVKNIHRLLSLVTDVDYTDTAGTVQEIYTEGQRICVRTDTAVYTAPIGTSAIVSIGSSIVPGDIIFDSFSVSRGTSAISNDDYPILSLGQGFLASLISSSLLFPNELVDITTTNPEDIFSLVQIP